MAQPVHYLITGSAPLARGHLVCAALGGERPQHERVRCVPLETFDRRLADADRILTAERAGRRFVLDLRHAASERLDWTGEVPRLPRLAADFPTAGLRTLMSRMLGPRALLPGAALELERWRHRLHASNGKLIAELILERYDGPRLRRHHGGEAVLLRLRGLRGYEAESRVLAGHLAHEPDLTPLTRDLAAFLAEAAGTGPHVYVAKPAVRLDPGCPAAAGAAAVLKANFAVMRANEWGIRDDVDSEFLHDFRVAMRRMRSVFMDFRKDLPPGDVAHFRTEFGWLNRLTGRPRDLDVMLEVMPKQLESIRADADTAAAIMGRLGHLRTAARAELLRELGGVRYRRFVTDWGKLLRRLARPAPHGKSLAQQTRRAIGKRHHRIVEHPWRAGGEEDALESLHELRKECKKLRYLIESFHTLYAPAAVKRAVGTLKTLQTAMGEAFDLHVQRALLAEVGGDIRTDPECAKLTAALAALDATFAATEERWIRTVTGALDNFRAAADRRVYRELLRSTKP